MTETIKRTRQIQKVRLCGATSISDGIFFNLALCPAVPNLLWPDLPGPNLPQRNLSGTNLPHQYFQGPYLQGPDLPRSNLPQNQKVLGLICRKIGEGPDLPKTS